MDDVISLQPSEDGYRLGDNITRAEIAKIAIRLTKGSPSECTGKVFADVGSGLGDLCGFIEAAAGSGIVSTANPDFRPGDLVTRAEMIKMLLAATGTPPSDVSADFSDVNADMGDLHRYLNAAAEKGIVVRTATFRPNSHASRGEAFKVAAKIQETLVVPNPEPLEELPLDQLFAPITSSGNADPSTVMATETVSISNSSFAPPSLNIKAGTKVVWKNEDSLPHTVTFDGFGSQTLNQNDQYEYTFSQTGTYSYKCSIHPSMQGTVTVTQ